MELERFNKPYNFKCFKSIKDYPGEVKSRKRMKNKVEENVKFKFEL